MLTSTLANASLMTVSDGFFILTIVELAANAVGLHVVVIECRDHIADNAWSEIDPPSASKFTAMVHTCFTAIVRKFGKT
jgi:UDP-galactopyranose mutase